MSKLYILLIVFTLSSCKTDITKNESFPVKDIFIAQNIEHIGGRCNTILMKFIDNSNGNLIYISENCYGISTFVIENRIK